MTKTVKIKSSEAIYFNHLSYDIKGYQLLNRMFDNEEFRKKQKELEEERMVLADTLIERYIDRQIKDWFVSIDIQTNQMEVVYNE